MARHDLAIRDVERPWFAHEATSLGLRGAGIGLIAVLVALRLLVHFGPAAAAQGAWTPSFPPTLLPLVSPAPIWTATCPGLCAAPVAPSKAPYVVAVRDGHRSLDAIDDGGDAGCGTGDPQACRQAQRRKRDVATAWRAHLAELTPPSSLAGAARQLDATLAALIDILTHDLADPSPFSADAALAEVRTQVSIDALAADIAPSG